MQRPRNAYFDPCRHLHPAMPTLIPLLTNSSISKFKPRARWIGNRFLQSPTDQEEIMVLQPLVANQVCRCSSVQDHHTLRLGRRKLPPHFNGGGEGLFLLAGPPGGGRLWWNSNLNGGLHSSGGVGPIRFFARLERRGGNATPILLLWTLWGIMVFAVKRVTPIPPPRAPINRILHPSSLLTTPRISNLRFCSPVRFTVSTGRALGFPIRNPYFKILFFGRRVHFLLRHYVLSRCILTKSKQASYLRRRLGKAQCVA